MSNRIQGISPRMAEIGKIKIGEHTGKKVGNTLLPGRLEHFRVTTTEKDKQKLNFLPDESVMAAIGEEPTEVPIILPFDDVDMNFQTSYALYAGRQCICRGDGKKADMLFLKDGKTQAYQLLDEDQNGDTVQKNERRPIFCDPVNCPNRLPDAKNVIKCKPNGRLICIIPASKRLNGYFFFRTTSYNTISFILGAMDDMKEQTGGILRGIPAKLFFFKKNTESHGNVPVVSIDWDFDEIDKFQKAVVDQRQNRIQYKENIKLLESRAMESGILEDRDDPADVAREFYPEQTAEHQEQKKKIAENIEERSDSVLDGVTEVETVEAEEVTEEPAEAVETEDKPADETEETTEDKKDLGLFG